MAEGGCAKCSRLLLIIFNFVFWISGGALLGVGIFFLVSDEWKSFLGILIDMNLPLKFLAIAAYVLIAVGAFVFIAGFCGCCGAVRESAVMLGIYIFCMIIVMIGELSAGVYVAVEKENLEKIAHDGISESVKNYTGTGNSTIDFIQIELSCCGSDNFTDYRYSYWIQEQTPPLKTYVPETCCRGNGKPEEYRPVNIGLCQEEAEPGSLIPSDKRTELRDKGCFPSIMEWLTCKSVIFIDVGIALIHGCFPSIREWLTCKSVIFIDVGIALIHGCFPSIMEWLTSKSVIFIGVGVGIALIQVLGIIFAICLCRNRSDYYDM
ncbi:hypothetical protein LOTGIDRAFT_171957 [Lottia gigantea]|uniref:Uncharacterized protein n=1 Tax=Lottia gigantea TaxID=225164 RepID=V4B4Y7_LOTGI|nr:hypothetical protein LOTGIDRAFT_171957 [Lottia gigantea]ESP02556.1 hypothetical protein LOTGIDRAFT_171957 [Lottia gigantea]